MESRVNGGESSSLCVVEATEGVLSLEDLEFAELVIEVNSQEERDAVVAVGS